MATTTMFNFNVRKKFRDLFCKLKFMFKNKKEETSMSINDFPDEILISILSILPIQDAFRTRVLSKRWFTLCYLLPILDFSTVARNRSNLARDQILFHQMLADVMFSPHSHLPLKSFRFEYSFDILKDEWSGITGICIEAAKQRGVRGIYLSLLPVILAPTTIFCCKTLVLITLRRVHVASMLNCVVDLPVLKTLTLRDRVRFEVGMDVMKLLSGCPKLEELNIRSVIANDGVRVGDYLKPLSSLIIVAITLFEIPYRAVYNVKTLIVRQFGSSRFNEEMNSFYKGFPTFQNLTRLKLLWALGRYIPHDWNEVLKVLPNCPNLQTLQMIKAGQTPFPKVCIYPRRVPECISSNLIICEIIGYQAYKEDFQFATYILQNAKVLQVMNIRYRVLLTPEHPQFLEDLSSYPRISPICKLSVSTV